MQCIDSAYAGYANFVLYLSVTLSKIKSVSWLTLQCTFVPLNKGLKPSSLTLLELCTVTMWVREKIVNTRNKVVCYNTRNVLAEAVSARTETYTQKKKDYISWRAWEFTLVVFYGSWSTALSLILETHTHTYRVSEQTHLHKLASPSSVPILWLNVWLSM